MTQVCIIFGFGTFKNMLKSAYSWTCQLAEFRCTIASIQPTTHSKFSCINRAMLFNKILFQTDRLSSIFSFYEVKLSSNNIILVNPTKNINIVAILHFHYSSTLTSTKLQTIHETVNYTTDVSTKVTQFSLRKKKCNQHNPVQLKYQK